MSIQLKSVEVINSLKASIENTTDTTYNNLTEAVQALADEYGETDVTDFSNFCLNGTRLDIVDKFDTSKAENFNNMFQGCTTLERTPRLDLSNAKRVPHMFDGCTNLTEVRISNANNLEQVEYMFNQCKSLEAIPDLNTSNCTDFTNMFNETPVRNVPYLDTSKAESCASMFNRQYCADTTLVLSNVLDVSNCTNCESMFRTRTLKTFPIKNTENVVNFRFAFWGNDFTEAELDLTSCTDMRTAFYQCSRLTTLTLRNADQVTSSYWDQCFSGCTNLTTLNIDILNIVSNTLNFSNCNKLSVDSLLNILNALSDNSGLSTTYTVKLGATNLNKLSAEQKQIATNKNIALT